MQWCCHSGLMTPQMCAKELVGSAPRPACPLNLRLLPIAATAQNFQGFRR
jgi:hypothetical protein